MTEATKIFLGSLKNQSFSVILTLVGLVALTWWHMRYEEKMDGVVSSLTEQVRTCDTERTALAIEVARLTEKFNALASADFHPLRRKR